MPDTPDLAAVRERDRQARNNGPLFGCALDRNTLLALVDRLTERCDAYKGQIEAGATHIASLEAESAKLWRLLEPFRRYAEKVDSNQISAPLGSSCPLTCDPLLPPSCEGHPTLGDCRAALSEKEPT